MADFNVRADAVDVEQIMRQIRGRIREKRGVDYTEEQIQELAKVKLEKFLDPKGVRSDLLEQFRQMPSGVPPTYAFDDQTLFQSDKPLVRFFRKLLHPFLKLLFNPNPLNQVLHQQVAINRFLIDRTARDILFYEVVHNLVLEMTRASIDVKNMKMRVESIASRLEFNERRARALEAVVQYRPDAERGREHDRDRDRDRERRGGESRPQTPAMPMPEAGPGPGPVDPLTGGDSLRSRRKRRRRGRRSGPGFGDEISHQASGASHPASETSNLASGTTGHLASEASHSGSGASELAPETSHFASEPGDPASRGPGPETGTLTSASEASDPAPEGSRPEASDRASSES
jgi:hypothetical protein